MFHTIYLESCTINDEAQSRSFRGASMSWRDVVTNWLSSRKEGNLAIMDLLRHLVRANMIPATFIDNQTLQSILITQVILETL